MTNSTRTKKAVPSYDSSNIMSIPLGCCQPSPFQRPISEVHVSRIIKNFDKNKVNPIMVNEREGRYYVIDGQHTICALKRLFGEHISVQAKIIKGLSLQQEAEYFVKQYEETKKLSALDIFNGRLFYEAKAKRMEQLAKSCGLKIGNGNNKTTKYIGAVTQYEKMYDVLGEQKTIEVLSLIKRAWENENNPYQANILSGFTVFYNTYKDVPFSSERIIEVLSKVTPREFLRHAGDRVFSSKAKAVAYELYSRYNKGLKSKKLPNIIEK